MNLSVPQGSILGPTLFDCYGSTVMEIIPEQKKILCLDMHMSML